MTKFNEDSRVKIPTLIHLVRLGYKYQSLKNINWDVDTNIFPDIFKKSIKKINPELNKDEISRFYDEVKISLDNEDLGKSFYEKLIDQSNIKLIDFENFNENNFHLLTELPYKNGSEEFRPDITLLINGLPLIFIEVKKPNNKEGILAERERIVKRFQNSKFRRFVNITQFMIFSNNMEYQKDSALPLQGAFYAAPSYENPIFNFFREEKNTKNFVFISQNNDDLENEILKDNNLTIIKNSPEFITNKDPSTPTNRICNSLLSRDRISFVLRYGFAYVKEIKGIQKHIMRYPQMFATLAIEEKLSLGSKKGIIWHTQGSGKTALAYFNIRYLTDYFQNKKVIPKFYFIVDRLDLLIQSQREFSSRGIVVHIVNSRDEFAKDIKSSGAIHNISGKLEITVVNIQKFKEDPDVIKNIDYSLKVQRIYFLDEVHRSYNPKGSFLANLSESDKDAIKIGLTGTPLLGTQYNSKLLFGDYIHKYYYNASIADGYTLRLIREEIESNYKMKLRDALSELEVLEGEINKKLLFSHRRFVKPMLDYIIEDFNKSRITLGDKSFGAMVICDSSDQARKMNDIFMNENYENSKYIKGAALILHDEGSKESRKEKVELFKEGEIDILFVYNMLITGFDSKRLKKLYLGRVIKRHNLLQALTRVNRTYKDFRYGYVVDFADIRKEFDATNKAYFKELQEELGDELDNYSNLFKSKEDIENEIEEIKDTLFRFDIENAENFSKQISQIENREEVQLIKKALSNSKDLYNLIRLLGEYEILDKLDFKKLGQLYREASNHLDLLNLKENLENNSDTSNLLNVALEDVLFMFKKVNEEELILADKLKNTLKTTREALGNNFDQKDPLFINLREELERLFKKKNLNEVTQEDMNANIESLNEIYNKTKELNYQNELLAAKYKDDKKYVRVHKRIMQSNLFEASERKIYDSLIGLKSKADEQVIQNSQIINNENYFDRMLIPIVINEFQNENKIKLNPKSSKYINNLIVKEYMNEFHYGLNLC